VVPHQVVSNEERIHPGQTTADQRVPLLTAQRAQGLERSAVIVGVVPAVARVVLHDPFDRRTKFRVVLDNDDAWLQRKRLPDPIVIAVDVDTQQIEFAQLRRLDEAGDVVRSDEGLSQLQPTLGNLAREGPLHGAIGCSIRLDPQPTPTPIQQQPGIGLQAVLDTELDERSLSDPEAAQDLLQDSILVILRKRFEAVPLEAFRTVVRARSKQSLQVHLEQQLALRIQSLDDRSCHGFT
jgi:hypothetical protein